MSSGGLEVSVESMARDIKKVDLTPSFLGEKASEFLHHYVTRPIKKELKARRLARELENLEISSQQISQPDVDEYRGSGLFSWFNGKLGNSSAPARFAYTLPLTVAAVSALEQGCSTHIPQGGETPFQAGIFDKPDSTRTGVKTKTNNGSKNPFEDIKRALQGINSDKREVKADYTKILNYLEAKYLKKDPRREFSGPGIELMKSGIPLSDLVNVYQLNKYLIPQGHFLTYGLYKDKELIKVFKIDKADDFCGFVDAEGKKRNDIFGFKFGCYKYFLLGEEVFSTQKRAHHFGVEYKVDGIGRVIGIPYLDTVKDYGRYGDKVVEEIIESDIIHELTHILFRTPIEEFALIAGLGYKMDEGVKISRVEDIPRFLETKQLTQSKLTRIKLDDVYFSKFQFGPFAKGMASLRENITSVTQEVHQLNPALPKDPLKMSDHQLYATMRFLFNQFGFVHKQYNPN